ncbi:hypothetical protein TRFO_41548 [Tritrichomonas foetus]|uniref:Uncharacterized protein n=1 Tax=Tritrichomonas foetus TaxID=1144522 RepID=A0A1J4KZW0_9EUKA|nr:hypothetical protein TRFO_41548 [Tritrichomonas foetus]|eukprot:OHT16793.1 hypothetical protein TRFO_41548 [Tritrichomonas foetus]
MNVHTFSDDKDLRMARAEIRGKMNFKRAFYICSLNYIASKNPEDFFNGIHRLEVCANKYKNEINIGSDIKEFHFNTLLKFYIIQIHSEAPLLEELNFVLFLLHFTDFIDVENPKRVADSFQTDLPCFSLTQPDSMNFLINGLNNLLFSENCLNLLAKIARLRNNHFPNIFCQTFFDFIQANPDSSYGEAIYYLIKQDVNDHNFIPRNKEFLSKLLFSSNITNILFSLKAFLLIWKIENRGLYEDALSLLFQKIPEFLLSNNARIIVAALKIVFLLEEIPDSILYAIFKCLPSKFKKGHNEAFLVMHNNAPQIVQIIPIAEIVEVIENCFHSEQYQVKKNALKLLETFSHFVSITNLINIEAYVVFLDDLELAEIVIPLIVSAASVYQSNNRFPEFLEIMSNYVDQLYEIIESASEPISQMTSVLKEQICSHE